MNTISSYILEILNDDIMQHGLLVQCVEDARSGGEGLKWNWKDVLEELLLKHEVEIGETSLKSTGYVEFIGWRGDVNERLARAVECINQATGYDQEFAYWICLRKNIDHYEGEE